MAEPAPTDTPPAEPRTSPTAVASLVCGLLGCFCLPFLGSLPAIVLGHLSRSQIRRDPEHLTGDGFAVIGLVLGYCGLLLWAALTAVVVALVIPQVVKQKDKAQVTSDMSNLRQLGMALEIYASDNQDQLPPKFSDVAAGGYAPYGRIWLCPRSTKTPPANAAQIDSGSNCDYVYLGQGLDRSKLEDAGRTVMVYGQPGYFKAGFNVLFADGHVQFVQAPDIRTAAKLNGWVLPSPPTTETPTEKTAPAR